MTETTTKTIRVSERNHSKLWKFKESPDETFDDALGRVLSRADSPQ